MSDEINTILETEWSHFIAVEDLDGGTNMFSLSPDEDARARVAQRLGVVSLDSLTADLRVGRRSGQSAYYVSGKIKAKVTQNCVLTMEPVAGDIEGEFETWFADPDGAVSIAKVRHEKLTEKGHGEQPILSEKDDPEPLQEGQIDLGEVVTQYLCLAVDPYPHVEGVEVDDVVVSAGPDGDDLIANPFAALKDWKDKLSED